MTSRLNEKSQQPSTSDNLVKAQQIEWMENNYVFIGQYVLNAIDRE
jgi:hypothetical protein